MWTNFIDAASTSLCRGLNGVLGSYPTACLVNAGRPALFLATVALVVVGIGLSFGLKKLRSAPASRR